jgi:hypothetical protein
MFKNLIRLGLVAALALGFAAAASAAEETTVTGKVLCGKCSLKKADGCQNVVVADGQEYWLAKSPAADKFGHVCKGEKTAKVTGTVAEKDGKKWLTASTMEEIKTN